MTSSARSFLRSWWSAIAGLAGIAVVVALIVGLRGGAARVTLPLMQRVSAASSLRMDFPEPMDHASVEERLQTPENVHGTLTWEGDTLVYKPQAALTMGESYVFRVDRHTKKSSGEPLGKDLDFTFIVSGAPAVTVRIPAPDATDIEPNTSISLVFDRPMVPLTQVQGAKADEMAASIPVTITPAIAGKFRWISTYALQFVPADGLRRATAYEVRVPAGIPTALGEKTEKDFSWTFETLRPQATTFSPENMNESAGPTTPISITFNEDIDLQSAKEHVRLFVQKAPALDVSPPGEMGDMMYGYADPEVARKRFAQFGSGTAFAVGSVRYGTTEKNGAQVTDRRTIVVTPAKTLPFQHFVRVTVTPGLRGTEGDLGSTQAASSVFSTVGELAIQKIGNVGNSVQVLFTSPVLSGSLVGRLHMKPEPANWKENPWILDTWNSSRALTINGRLDPSTSYTLTIQEGVKDQFGQTLAKPYTFTFKTPPLDPQVFINSKGSFGIFERDKKPVFYLNGVNVSVMNVSFARLTFDEFMDTQKAAPSWGISPTVPLAGKTDYRTWAVDPKLTKDRWKAVPFDVAKQTGAALAPGIYVLQMQSPEYVDPQTKQPIVEQQFFSLTSIGVTLKYSGNRVLVWAVDLKTGAPVAGATVKIRGRNGSTPAVGTTDAQGFFDAAVDSRSYAADPSEWQPVFWASVQKGDDIAFAASDWTQGIEPYAFGLWSDYRGPSYPQYDVSSFIYTDRPLYRAGDTVHFKGIVRLRDRNGVLLQPGVSRTAQVKIIDGNGSEVYAKVLPLSPYGGFSDALPTATSAALGNYSISMTLLPDAETGGRGGYGNFSVLAYRKPEFKVAVTAAKPDYFDKETVSATVDGSYYFGAPMAGAPVTWRAQTSDYYFNRYTGNGWYSFALEDAWCWFDCAPGESMIAEGKGTLDAAGKMQIKVPFDLQDKAVSQIATIEADVTDPSNQVVSDRASVPVHKSRVYVGVKTDDYVVTPGTEATIDVVTLQPDGSPAPNQRVTLELFSRVWNTVRTKGVDGQYYEDNEPTDMSLRTVRIATDAKGIGHGKVAVDKGGQLRVVASTKDSDGRESKAGTSLYAWSSTYVNWPHANTDRLDVTTDKPSYKPGETAKLLVKSPYQGRGVKALVTIERENVIWKKVIDVEGNALPIEIPVTEEMIPNVFASVVIVKPRQGETFDDQGLDTGVPAFKIGYVELPVEKESKRLSVSIETDRPAYKPGDTVTVALHAKTPDGKPAKAELSLGVVDLSVLALSGYRLPDLIEDFYAEHGLGVMTAQMLTHLLDRYKPGSKGGGGGPEESARGDFRDTAFWVPSVVTDANGNATLTFKLPDNLTTWKLVSMGSTTSHLFGAGELEILETKDVIIRPVRPRFAVQGDRVTVAAIVHNQTQSVQTFAVSLKGTGFVLRGKATQQVRVQPGADATVEFPLTAGYGDELKFSWSAVGDQGRDAVNESIPVYAFGTPQSVSTTGITENTVTEKVFVPPRNEAATGSLSVTVSPSIATYLPSGLSFLATYPYGCAEQVTSSFVGSVALSKLQGFDAFSVVSKKTLATNVSAGLQKLYAFQQQDGGFGYFENSGSYPPLTAYVLSSLQLTKSAGFAVDAGVMQRAHDYLNTVLRSQDPKDQQTSTNRALILFALSETGQTDPNLAANLYEQRAGLPLFAKAQLAMTLNASAANKAKAKTLLTEILNAAKVDPRGTHFEEKDAAFARYFMNTDTRTTALVLQAMIRLQPNHPMIPAVVRYLLDARRDGHWDTTQSTVQTIIAFTDFLKATNELDTNQKVSITVAGKEQLAATFDKSTVLTRKSVSLALDDLARGKESDVTVNRQGTGRLYYDMLLSYVYTGGTIEPLEQGMSIVREVEPVLKSPSMLTTGGTYRVRLTVTVPEDRHFVAVESPLPAGMEPIDLQFETSQQAGLQDATQEKPWWMQQGNGMYTLPYSHKELRDDRVFLFTEHLPAGVYQFDYLVRATTAGTFRQRPTRAFEMYHPETFGQTSGEWVTIK